MNVRFLESVPYDALMELRARIASAWSPLFCMEAELLHDKKIMAKAAAKFVLCGYRPD
jgi:hypothetical protein